MLKRTLLFAIFAAALAANTLGQTSYHLTASSNASDDGLSRSRRVAQASAVAAAVVINTKAAERTAFDLLNQQRVANGLKPLVWSDELATIARLHSRNMAEQKFFGHRGLDNKMVSDRADDIGLKKWRAIGENIAFNRGYGDPIEKAVELWLDSPSHRRNLLNDEWRETAVGVAVAEDGSYYFTQVFLLRK
jgi:uncharacterized protein YkwD